MTGRLDLAEHVGGEQDGAPGGPAVVEKREEPRLHQRVEPLRRLVHHDQLGVVLQRLDDAELLSHSARVRAHGPRKVLVGEGEGGAGVGPQDRWTVVQA